MRVDETSHGARPATATRVDATSALAPHSELQSQQQTLVGVFASYDDAQSAYHALRAIAPTPGEVSLLTHESDLADEYEVSSVAGGAAAGAAIGGLLGALAGWMSAVGALAIPGIGAAPNGMQLSSTLGGLGLGAAIGGLIGAISGLQSRMESDQREIAALKRELGESRILVAVQPFGTMETEFREILNSNRAESVRLYSGTLARGRSEDNAIPVVVAAAPVVHMAVADTVVADTADEETTLMDDRQTGRNLDNVTGTEGAIDPETGAFGTAGTPLTTGYGVSGSTVGVGSSEGERSYQHGEHAGSTPDQKAYELGGRSSDDAVVTDGGEPDRISVGDTYNATNAGRADVQQEPEERDLYQRGPSYGPDTDMHPATDATEYYSGSSVEEGPSYGTVNNESSQASGGTDIPGTSDPRGIGDNTDDPNLPD